jgi:hypothetical protein
MTDDDIVGIRMTTPGDIKAFARAIEKKVRAEMIKIGQYYFNPYSITWIINREVHFNNGKSIILTEPELQDLFAILFDERSSLEIAIEETKKDLNIKPKKVVKKK